MIREHKYLLKTTKQSLTLVNQVYKVLKVLQEEDGAEEDRAESKEELLTLLLTVSSSSWAEQQTSPDEDG